MSLWGRVHIQIIILGDMFPSVRAPSYDTRDPLEDLNTHRVALWQWLESDFGKKYRFPGTSLMLGGLGLTAWEVPSLRDITVVSSFLQVFPLSSRQLRTSL